MTDKKFEDFEIGDVGIHEKGNEECPDCWSGYPKKCECGGLIHGEFGDEDKDCNYWLFKKCDKCGEYY